MIAVEDGDSEKTDLTSSHSAVEDSQTFDSEGEANQTSPSPTSDSESEGEKVDLMSCLDVHYQNRDGPVFMGYWFMTREVNRSGLQYMGDEGRE